MGSADIFIFQVTILGSAFMKIIRKIIICILIIIIAYCAYNIIIYYTDSYNNKKVYKDIRNIAFNSSENSSPDSSSDIESFDRLNYNKLLNTNPDFCRLVKNKRNRHRLSCSTGNRQRILPSP